MAIAPAVDFSSLHGADGSATFSSGGYTVTAAVNGPIEVQRRDELPEDAAIEVNVRPASGVGMVRERHLEQLLANTLKEVILTRDYPRTLIQITLQITSVPETNPRKAYKGSPSSIMFMLSALAQAALLALLDAGTPLRTTYKSVLAAIAGGDVVLVEGDIALSDASSMHFFVFTSGGDLLATESEGDFDVAEYHRAYQTASASCTAKRVDQDDEDMSDDANEASTPGVPAQHIARAVEQKIRNDQAWRT